MPDFVATGWGFVSWKSLKFTLPKSSGPAAGGPVSCYHLSRLMFDLKIESKSVYERAFKDFESVMGEYDLSGRRERRAALGRSAQAPPTRRARHALPLYQETQS